MAFLDEYAESHRVPSRSSVLQKAVALLRSVELADSYAAAWSEWDETDAEAWDGTVADGLIDRSDAPG